MARGSFGRTVARAAASGGSKSYRARRPVAWYLLMLVIVALGCVLVVYSRNEALRTTSSEGPTASDNWYAGLAVDICGKIEPNLPASTNFGSTGLRTYGDGLINASPGALTSGASAYEGSKATLGLFAKKYSGFTLTATKLHYPGKGQRTWKNGDRCVGVAKGKGRLSAAVWTSSTATTPTIVADPAKIHISNGEMITVAFLPPGTAVPAPPAATRATLVEALTGSSGSSTTTSSNPGAKK
ncbi:MAG TPA: hypothetical protein VED84_01610 [Acidimicrobiales bacterium]|nr:hypothetical protein [Acidimicrobiales bacterium]